MTVHSARASAALQLLAEQDPAIALLALWCRHEDRDHAAPARSDGQVISYGPSFDLLTMPEQAGLAAHHVLHIALGHSGRAQALADRMGQAFAPDLFNLCADGLINEVLGLAGYALPRPAVLASGLLGQMNTPAGDPAQTVQHYDAERLYMAICHPAKGGAQDSQDRADRYRETQSFQPDLDRAPDPATVGQQAQSDWQGRLAQALAAGRQAGRGIGAMGYQLADLPTVRTPWGVVLRGLLAQQMGARLHPDMARPARSWLARDAHARQAGTAQPVFEPGLRTRIDQPKLVVAMDMSSSVDDTLLAQFAAELAAIVARTGAALHLWLFDEQIRARHVLRPAGMAAQITALRLARDGGTSFVDVLQQADQMGPSAVVILSDLEGPLGPAPRCKVIWACPVPPDHTPPFGRVLLLDR